jgi:hypothetical protein
VGLSLYLMQPERVTSWSYSGFNLFRERLAKEIDLDLRAMEGYGGDRPWSAVKDPLVPLLNHSDAEGAINEEECRTIAPRLRELVRRWPDDDPDREQGEALADAMEEAAEIGGEISFR